MISSGNEEQHVARNGELAAVDAGNLEMKYERLRHSPENVILDEGTDEQLECVGYCRCAWKNFLFAVWCFVSMGIPLLLVYWRPKWELYLRWSRCPLSYCTLVLLKDCHHQLYTAKVERKNVVKFPAEFSFLMLFSQDLPSGTLSDHTQLTANQEKFYRYFVHQHVKYVWDNNAKTFCRLRGYDSNTLCSDFYERYKGFSKTTQMERIEIFGDNEINVEIKSYGKLLTEEILNPFYIFQIFSIILWCSDEYYYYAVCIFVLSFVSVTVQLIKTRKQSETLSAMVTASSSSTVCVLRQDEVVDEVPASLVPGDVIVIPSNGCTMVCDAVLVAGNCIVNESMLTGESVPETKTPLLFQEEEIYDSTIHKRHTIFSGTKVIQTRYYGSSRVLAVVVRTGFNTAKGELVRSILYPKPIDFKFYKDSLKFICVLAFIAMLGMSYSMYIFITRGEPLVYILKRVLDIITIVVPPALPAAMTVGSVYAQSRLRKKDIFCISPPRINVCGKLKLFCFDKTGTLTEDGLDFLGVVPVLNDTFQPVVLNATELSQKSDLLAAMATCHSLTMIEGKLTGDPLDVKMFEATNWELEEAGLENTRFDRLVPTIVHPLLSFAPFSESSSEKAFIEVKEDHSRYDLLTPTIVKPVTKDTYIDVSNNYIEGPVAETEFKVPYEIGIVRQFPFSSSLQMMSVVTRTLGKNHMDLYVKGAPEKICSLCDKSSIPADFDRLLHSYTVRGYRVIAMACRSLDSKLTWHQVQRIKRDQVEKDLFFLGFLIMQNALKPETTPVIKKLKEANIRSVMVTGDNLHTAISVGRDCDLLSEEHKVVVIKAFPPEDSVSARIQWESLDAPMELPHLEDSFQSLVSINIDCCDSPSLYRFAIDGKSFAIVRQYFPELLSKVAIQGTIFARMSPDQKAQLVELLQQFGYIVGMCGDGANDCGALKAAHVGISLSETEASVAAPFTAKTQNIECVITVMQEGRCALVTSFSVFKYMALYSMIQFISVVILYSSMTNLSDAQFLYIDLGITTTMAIFMGYTRAHETLVAKRPHGTLLSFPILASIILQIFLALAMQLGAFFYLKSQIWFVAVQPFPGTKFTPCVETTVIFCISTYQYVIVAAVCSKGKPFRKPFYTNIPMLVSILLLIAFSIFLMLYPVKVIANFLQLEYPNDRSVALNFFLMLLVFPASNLIASASIEIFLDSQTSKKIGRVVTCKRQPRNLYKILEATNDRPPIGQVTYSSVTSS